MTDQWLQVTSRPLRELSCADDEEADPHPSIPPSSCNHETTTQKAKGVDLGFISFGSSPTGSSSDLIGNGPSRSKTHKALDLWQWLRTPLGILVTLYGLNVVAWGGMLFLLLCNAAPAMCDPSFNDPNSPRRKWIEIDSQILNALFCVPGFGLAPWRMRDLYLWIRWRIAKDDAAFARLCHTHRAWFDCAPEEMKCKGAGIAQETVDISGYSASTSTPLWKMSMVVWCNTLNTVFQACLAGCMWGMNRFTRPSWTTGLFVGAACICAGLGGWITYKEEQRRKKKQQSLV